MKHCEFKNCKAKIPLSLYDTLVCNTCLKHFCLLHRIPEDHKCLQMKYLLNFLFYKKKNKIKY